MIVEFIISLHNIYASTIVLKSLMDIAVWRTLRGCLVFKSSEVFTYKTYLNKLQEVANI